MNASLRKVQRFIQDISMVNGNKLKKGWVKGRRVTIQGIVTSLRPGKNDIKQHGIWKAKGDGDVGD